MFHGWLEVFVEFLANTAFYAYLIVFAIGLLWVVIGLVLGGLSGMMEFAHDIVADLGGDAEGWGQQQVGLSPLSPLMLAIFGMLFGVTGMTLTAFTGFTVGIVLLLTVVVSTALDALVYFGLFSFFIKSQSSSLAHVGEAVGSFATVSTRVTPEATGTINYEIAGRRTLAGARSADAVTHEAGEVVRIVSMDGGVARVVKKDQ